MDRSKGDIGHSEGDHSQHEWLDVLFAYATAISLGQEAKARYPLVAQHLDYCSECQAALTQLLNIVEPLYDGTLKPVELQHSFDLSFLAAPISAELLTQQSRTSEPQQSNLIDRFVIILDQQLGRLRSQFSALTDRPILVQARGAALVDYLPDPETTNGVIVSIQIYANDADVQMCDLMLAMILPDDRQASNGFVVTIRTDNRVREEMADESGVIYIPAAISRNDTMLRINAQIL